MIIHSDILGKDMEVSVYIPKVADGEKLPVLYFFHGRSGSDKILDMLGMDKVADEMTANGEILPLIIVCPNLEKSRGVNTSEKREEFESAGGTVNTGRYEDYIIKELIPKAEAELPAIGTAEGRMIGGISSGGYAALHIALNNSEMFGKVGGHMPAVELELDDEDLPYFVSRENWVKCSPITLAREKTLNKSISVYLDAGDKDEGHFYDGCKVMYDILRSRGIDVQNHIFAGHHNAEYIIGNLREYFRFYAGTPKKSH